MQYTGHHNHLYSICTESSLILPMLLTLNLEIYGFMVEVAAFRSNIFPFKCIDFVDFILIL